MMFRSVLTVGASHHTTSSVSLASFGRAAEALRTGVRDPALRGRLPVREIAVLSTCARVEIYAVPEDGRWEEAVRMVEREVFGADVAAGSHAGPYRLEGRDAVRHLCRVAAGIESFVVGEHEIAGQVARAFKEAVRLDAEAGVLEGVAKVARHASRSVRSRTAIGRYPASVSSVAVEIVKGRLGNVAERRAVVVGTGRAGRLVAGALRSSGVDSMTVVSRSEARAQDVAREVRAGFGTLDRLGELVAGADVVLTASGAEEPVLDRSVLTSALRARGSGAPPLLVVDLALPGDVAPDAHGLDGLELLSIEDVKARVRRHVSLRREQLSEAVRVVEEVVQEFAQARAVHDVESLIGDLRRSIEGVRSTEVERWLARGEYDLPPNREELDHQTRSIVNKLLHDPMRRLRSVPPPSGPGRPERRTAPALIRCDRIDPARAGG